MPQDDSQKLLTELQVSQRENAMADALFFGIGDGAIAVDAHGKIERINQIALDLLGYKESELLKEWFPKMIIVETVDGDTIAPLDRPIVQAFLTGRPIVVRCFYRRKSGRRVPVSLCVSPILLDNKPVGAIQIFRDISQELEIDRMKNEFIAIASHQLRTPLTAIKLDAEMINDGYFGPISKPQKHQINMMLNSIGRMQELISTLLNITRIEAGKIGVRSRLLSLEKLVREITKELNANAHAKNIVLRSRVPKALPKLRTDALLVKEILANLVSNAIKYTPPGGTISISLRASDTDIIFRIQDSGYGIPPEEHDRIFTKFYRGSNITSKETVGTGLGLYMAKGVVGNLDGQIWFDSKPDKGTTFFVSLPLKGCVKKAGTTSLEPKIL